MLQPRTLWDTAAAGSCWRDVQLQCMPCIRSAWGALHSSLLQLLQGSWARGPSSRHSVVNVGTRWPPAAAAPSQPALQTSLQSAPVRPEDIQNRQYCTHLLHLQLQLAMLKGISVQNVIDPASAAPLCLGAFSAAWCEHIVHLKLGLLNRKPADQISFAEACRDGIL